MSGVVGGSGDLGADVIARAPDGRRIVLQAKRYRDGRSVGSQDVQRFGGTAHTIHGADVAAVVTTAHTFTRKHARTRSRPDPAHASKSAGSVGIPDRADPLELSPRNRRTVRDDPHPWRAGRRARQG